MPDEFPNKLSKIAERLESVVRKHNAGNKDAKHTHNNPGPEQKTHGSGAGSKHTLTSVLRAAATKSGRKGIPSFDEMEAMSADEVWGVASKVLGSRKKVQDMLDSLPERSAGENLNAEDVPPKFLREHFGSGEEGDPFRLPPKPKKHRQRDEILQRHVKRLNAKYGEFYSVSYAGNDRFIVHTNSPFERKKYGFKAFDGPLHETEAWLGAGGNENPRLSAQAVARAKKKGPKKLKPLPPKP